MSESKELAERLRADLLGEIAWEDDPKSLIDVINDHRAEAADLIERQAKIIEDMERFLSESFPTCVSEGGSYYVKVSYLTLEEAQSAYAALGNIARALTKQ